SLIWKPRNCKYFNDTNYYLSNNPGALPLAVWITPLWGLYGFHPGILPYGYKSMGNAFGNLMFVIQP
ncbi:MAG: hypothetical protein ACLFSF_08505, partial [Desulfonatronovibrio sp.]